VRSAVEISDGNVRDLSQLCDEFKFTELAKTVGDWQAEHPLIDPAVRRELDLVQARLHERLQWQARAMLMLDQDRHCIDGGRLRRVMRRSWRRWKRKCPGCDR
jgi:hypothetical protein